MRPISELINTEDSAYPMLQDFAGAAPGRCLVFPPSFNREDVLFRAQVTTRSPLGSVIYHTGGILVDRWIRIVGSGSEGIRRNLPEWNEGRASGFLLIADDAVGGFFAIDGGGLRFKPGDVCYWAPDSLNWISLERGYTDFIHWAMTGNLDPFYESVRWPGSIEDAARLSGDECFMFYPFLWTNEGSIEKSHRGVIPIQEAYDSKSRVLDELLKR